MAQSEPSIHRGDDTAELRARYNQLCAALTMSAGTNNAVADRVLQELQALAQKIAFRQAERDSTIRPSAGAASKSAAPVLAHGNVIAFRCRVKGQARENPRLPAALSALTERKPIVAFEDSQEHAPGTVSAPRRQKSEPAPAPAATDPTVAAA